MKASGGCFMHSQFRKRQIATLDGGNIAIKVARHTFKIYKTLMIDTDIIRELMGRTR
jgi:shikimate 5-dehydrogenase